MLLLLLLLLVLAVVCISIQGCNAVGEGGGTQVEADLDEEDDLEDGEEGWDSNAGGHEELSAADAMAKVANVNDRDAERVVAKFDFVLMLGFAPWCTQSQALLPEFAAAAAQLSRLGNPTVMAKLDAINNAYAASLYDIRGFPTLMFFVNGVREEYLGGHSRCAPTLFLFFSPISLVNLEKIVI